MAKFSVEINDKVWKSVTKRFESHGILTDKPEELMELILSQALSDQNPALPASANSSTRILITLSLLKVTADG